MPRYWDYSEKERAGLTEDQVKSMLTVEMMEKGVLDPGPCPKAEPPKPLDLPRKQFFRVKKSSYSHFDCVFPTVEAAAAFVALNPLEAGYNYEHGERTEYAKWPDENGIEAVSVLDYEDVRRHGAELKRIAAQNEANKKAIETHTETVKKANAVTDGVWSDWQDCRSADYNHKRLIETFNKYVALADGNEVTARRFLSKAYPEPKILEAFAWCGVTDPGTTEVRAA